MPLTNVLVELAVLRQLREPGGQLHGQAAHRRLAQHLQSAAVGGDVQARGRALVHLGKNVLGNLRREGGWREWGRRLGEAKCTYGLAWRERFCRFTLGTLEGQQQGLHRGTASLQRCFQLRTSSAVASLVGMAAISLTSTLTSAGENGQGEGRTAQQQRRVQGRPAGHTAAIAGAHRSKQAAQQPHQSPRVSLPHLIRRPAATAGPGGPWRWPGPCAAARR